jgi:aryl-alcohol dehydrogenase-like predicted oxidoreductase
MKIKNIGSQGLKASELGLGCMGMSEFYGEHDDTESIRTIHYALHEGLTFLDTADMYGPFLNELLLGKALKGKRQEVTLATKFGIVREPGNNQMRGLNGTPEYVQTACEASLKRLGTDVIDLYYLHRVDPATPIEVTVAAMGNLVKQGKIRGIGLSEVSASTLRKAHAIHPVSAVQSEYSLWSREPEEEVLATCKELGIAFVAYSPLGRGFLSGQIKTLEDLAPDDYRRNSPRFQGENFAKNLSVVEKISQLAKSKDATASQLALAWVMAQGDHIFPIPGTKRVSYLKENIASLRIKLSTEELKEIDAISPKGFAAGTRYPIAAMGSVNK